jgi:hypothetical protein
MVAVLSILPPDVTSRDRSGLFSCCYDYLRFTSIIQACHVYAGTPDVMLQRSSSAAFFIPGIVQPGPGKASRTRVFFLVLQNG